MKNQELRLSIVTCASLIASLLLFGFGCRKTNTIDTESLRESPSIVKPTKKIDIPPKPPTKPRSAYTEHAPAPEIFYIRQAWRELVGIDTFRARFTLPSASGNVTGSMEYSRDEGVHAEMNLGKQGTSELYILYGDVYFRSNSSTWENVTNTPDGDKLAQFFRIAFPGKNSTSTIFISDSATILEIKDDPRGCKQYSYSEFSAERGKEVSRLCIKNNLPMIMNKVYPDGETEIVYFDYNAPLKIGSPR